MSMLPALRADLVQPFPQVRQAADDQHRTELAIFRHALDAPVLGRDRSSGYTSHR